MLFLLVLVPSEVCPVLYDLRDDVGGEACAAAKDSDERGTVRARVGGKSTGGLYCL